MAETAEKKVRLHGIVGGRVQGVGFRYYVVDKCQNLGLTGWVRNRWDDTVEVTAEGDRAELDKLVMDLHHGPRAAQVSSVKVTWLEATGEFSGFSIHATY
jgi:acylphosphatase